MSTNVGNGTRECMQCNWGLENHEAYCTNHPQGCLLKLGQGAHDLYITRKQLEKIAKEIQAIPKEPAVTPVKRFISTKTYTHNMGFSCAFRQWRAESHCRFLHGYAIEIRMEFEADELDIRNWVVDFGSLKSYKQMLENTFDHKTLVARDDPKLKTFEWLHSEGIIDMVVVEATGCERFAELVFDTLSIWLKDNGYFPRVKVRKVEVREHASNSAIVIGEYAGL